MTRQDRGQALGQLLEGAARRAQERPVPTERTSKGRASPAEHSTRQQAAWQGVKNSRRSEAIASGGRHKPVTMLIVRYDNYDCQMKFNDPLEAQLRDVAWSMASQRPEPPGIWPRDPQDREAGVDERLAGCLALLRAYTRMSNALQRRIDVTADAAIELGASFSQVAAACRVSRQAARQRWLRHHDQRTESTAGPPEPIQPIPDYPGMSASSTDPKVAFTAGPQDRSQVANAQVRVRVHELAQQLGVEAREVMARLHDMGEFVRTTSSTIEPAIVSRLWQEFAVSNRRPGE